MWFCSAYRRHDITDKLRDISASLSHSAATSNFACEVLNVTELNQYYIVTGRSCPKYMPVVEPMNVQFDINCYFTKALYKALIKARSLWYDNTTSSVLWFNHSLDESSFIELYCDLHGYLESSIMQFHMETAKNRYWRQILSSVNCWIFHPYSSVFMLFVCLFVCLF
jgi:hypothetical protein